VLFFMAEISLNIMNNCGWRFLNQRPLKSP